MVFALGMDISNAVALVTGANRGLGAKFAEELVSRGARVYAGARDPGSVTVQGVTPVAIDTTDPATIAAAVQAAGDVTVLINNAGIARDVDLLTGDIDGARAEMDTNYFGTLAVIRAFAPVIEANGGGAILNVLSVLSWVHAAKFGAYAAAKAAGWAMTDALREELAPRGIHVAALHVGFMDTDMAEFVPADQKSDPAVVAAQALDGLFAGEPEILADELTRTVRAQLSQPPQVATL